jgi:hypothetical protein
VLDLGDPRRGQNVLAEGADRKSLEKFLKGFRPDNGSAIIKRAVPPSEPFFNKNTS